MRFTLPTDCGNSPRITIVGEFVTAWVERDAQAMAAWLADDAVWTLPGREAPHDDATADHGHDDIASGRLEVTSIITHGRLASCDGFLESDSGRTHFSHVFRFASTSKNAKIAEARTYLIDELPR